MAGTTVVLSGVGSMIFASSFEQLDIGDMPILRARARLVGRGPRICRYARIDVELAPWSVTAAQIRITPRSRYVHLWGVRRRRRYWSLAHGAANTLREMLMGCRSIGRHTHIEMLRPPTPASANGKP